jgi:hypothetical protein
MNGKTATVTKNIVHAIYATFFKVVSIDFLLQYSLFHVDQEIQNPNHPFGDINNTAQANNIQDTRITHINTEFNINFI